MAQAKVASHAAAQVKAKEKAPAAGKERAGARRSRMQCSRAESSP